MVQLMDLLRGPVFWVVILIILFAGAILFTAFAALIAQICLLLRLKPWNAPQRQPDQVGSYPDERSASQNSTGVPFRKGYRLKANTSARESAQQGFDAGAGSPEVVDAAWWQVNP
ncbi:MAG: hypothetical protein WCK35_03065 [Chloroflexota bacterium]